MPETQLNCTRRGYPIARPMQETSPTTSDVTPGASELFIRLVLLRPCRSLESNPLRWRPYCGYGHDRQPVYTSWGRLLLQRMWEGELQGTGEWDEIVEGQAVRGRGGTGVAKGDNQLAEGEIRVAK